MARERATILDDDRRGRSASGGPAWRGTVSERLQVAQRLPQAIASVTSYSNGRSAARRRFAYVSREGEISLEVHDGTMLEGLDEVDRFLDDWEADFSDRSKSRDVMNYFVSFPEGVDREKALTVAREFFAETFGPNHEYAFAPHDDTDNFHVHALVKLRGYDGKAMRRTQGTIEQWRGEFAAKAREHGILLDASPRRARAKAREATPRWLEQMRKRGATPRLDGTLRPDPEAERYQALLSASSARERLEFAKQARLVAQEAFSIEKPKDRLMALEIAADLAIFAEGIPTPRARFRPNGNRNGDPQPGDDLRRRIDRALQATKVEALGKPGAREAREIVLEVDRMMRKHVGSFGAGADQRAAIALRGRVSRAHAEPIREPRPEVAELPETADEMLQKLAKISDPHKRQQAEQELLNMVEATEAAATSPRSNVAGKRSPEVER